MEMPIRIIIVLFISILVGVAIINFSQDLMGKSKTKLESFDKHEDQADRILELKNIDSYQLGELANDCFTEFENSLEDQICYAIIANVDASNDKVIGYSNLDKENIYVDLSDAENAVKIKYNAIERRVDITG